MNSVFGKAAEARGTSLWKRWLVVAAAVVLLDQLTKQAADLLLAYNEPLVVMPVFNLTLRYNTGAAFSFLADAGGWQRWFFTLLALLVSAVLVVWLRRLPAGAKWESLGIALILGGAVGNVIDRLLLGHVIDFLEFHYQHWYWPAFNVADSAITVGVTLLILDNLFFSRGRRQKPQATE
ncbi:MAG: signal peptidase II [Gammaproteobacteria bacterium]